MTDQPGPGADRAAGAPEHGAACPDPADIAAYIDGLGPADDRTRVEDHISRCDDCYEVLRESHRTLQELGTARARVRRPFTPWLAAAAAVAVAVAGGTWAWRRAVAPPPALSVLVDAVGPRRLFEPRLVGGFRFGPLVSARRAGGVPPAEDFTLLSAAAQLQKRAGQDPTPENRRALAAAFLVLGQADRAVIILEALCRDRPDEATAWSDLAAAYLVRAGGANRSEDGPRALEAASRALELDEGLAEALFNKALALEMLSLRHQAREAWDACIARGGEWAEAAAEHRRRLDEQGELDGARIRLDLARALDAGDEAALVGALGESVEAGRMYFEEELLPAAAAGGPFALDRLGAFGRAFEQHTGDGTIAATALHLAAHQADPAVRALYLRYVAARRSYLATRWSEAEPGFARVVGAAAFRGSPLRAWADLHLAILEFHAGNARGATARLARLQEGVARGREPLLRGRVEWMLGLLAVGEGRFDAALRHYAAGASAFTSGRDPPHAANMAFQAGEVYQFLGRSASAWEHRKTALDLNHRFVETPRRVAVFFAAADHCTSAGLSRAASHFAREAYALAAARGTEASRLEAQLRLARALSRVRPAEALPVAEDVQAGVQRVADAALRDRLAGETRIILAEVKLAARAAGGEEALDGAIAWLSGRRTFARIAPLHLERGLLRARRGEQQAAREDLERVVALTRGMRSPANDLRVSHARLAFTAYERLIGLQLDRDPDPLAALLLAEERWQAADAGAHRPRTIRAIVDAVHQGLADDSVVLAFVPAEGELVSWSIRRGRADVVRRPVARGDLWALVDRMAASARGAHEDREAQQRLSSLLLGPHAAALEAVQRIFVVAGGSLWSVPFGLLHGASGLPLHRSATIAVVPSLRALAAGRPPRAPGHGRLVAFGFASGAADLPPLPRVEAEVRRIASGSVRSETATGAMATRAAFARLTRGATAIHFAGHAVLNEERPLYSSLIVSSGGGIDDYLTAQEIAGLDLRAADVVTLSTCAAAATSAAYGEGGLSLARSFLAAGAGAVIAPLWDVSDDGMPELMARLHEALADGAEPADAAARVLRWAETRNGSLRADARSLVVVSGQGALRPSAAGRSVAEGPAFGRRPSY